MESKTLDFTGLKIPRDYHEEKEDEFHAKRMESIQPLKW